GPFADGADRGPVTGASLRVESVVLGLALGLVAIALPLLLAEDPSALAITVHTAVGWSFVAAGAIAWARRPENKTGLLMTLTGLVWFGRNFSWWDAALPIHLSDLALWGFLALLGHQLVVFPYGVARTRSERLLVGSAYALAIGGYLLSQA